MGDRGQEAPAGRGAEPCRVQTHMTGTAVTAMRIIGAAEVAEALEDRLLTERLRQTFRSGGTIPVRCHHHAVPVPGGAEATLLLGRHGAGGSGRRATGLRPEIAHG